MIEFIDRQIDKLLKFATPQWFLIVTTTFGFFSLIELLYFKPVSAESKDILQIMLGAVASAWGATINYYFGSSSGSAKKTDIMATSSAVAATTAADAAKKEA